MTEPGTNTFVVLLSVDAGNTREAARLVVMKRFLDGQFASGATVLDEAMLVDHLGQVFLVLVQAADRQSVATALEPCEGVFSTQVIDVSLDHFDAAIADARYCVLATDVASAAPAASVTLPAPNPAVTVRYRVTVPPGQAYSSIAMVAAPSYHLAKLFGVSDAPGRYIKVANAVPLRDYFDARTRKPSDTIAAAATPSVASATGAATDGGYSIYNEGSAAVIYTQTDSVLPFTSDVMGRRTSAAVDVAIPVTSSVYLWRSLAGTFTCNASWWYDNGIGPNTAGVNPQSFPTASQPTLRWAYPDLVIPNLTSAAPIVAGFDLSAAANGFHPRNDLYLWLNDLLHTTKYDLAWPEDSYQGGSLAAYTYIVDQIPGRTPPNKGTLKEKEVIAGIAFPNNGQFTQAEFQDVQNHLLLEIDHFVNVDRWFGITGILYAINTLIAQSATNDLIGAVALMSISQPENPLMIVLDELFGMIEVIIAAIPEIGAVVAAVIAVAWTTAKMLMPNGVAEQTIQVAVAQMADTLNHYLQFLLDSTEAQRTALYGNWGKLQEFSNGVITGRISEKQFLPSGDPASNRNTAPYKPQGLVDAAADAWLLVIYQKLFSIWHSPTASLSFSSAVPANPWNPDAGQYAFTWTIPASWYDSKGTYQGYMVMSCATDAPAQVLQTLFGTNSRLHVNPIEFYTGLNGWPTVVPLYDRGKVQDIPAASWTLVPIVEFGF